MPEQEFLFALDMSGEPPFDGMLAELARAVRGHVGCGSAAIDMCLVADGTYDAYWERRLNAWDLAAGAAVLLSAGGTVTALDGGRVDLTRGHLIASNGRVHGALPQLLAD